MPTYNFQIKFRLSYKGFLIAAQNMRRNSGIKSGVSTAIPDAPLRRTLGSRAGMTAGSSCDPSKFGIKSTCKNK
jgi:hypothetical protein